MRRLAPELLVTVRTQRWNPEEFLRTLIQAEITSRDESNARTRMRNAAFPVNLSRQRPLDETMRVSTRRRDPIVAGSAAARRYRALH